MKLSVVLSTYNGAGYIAEQLDSIRKQTRQPDEVLIIDDCSSDGTVKFVDSFIKEYKLHNWHLIVNEQNKGWKRNFMEGLWSAEGDLLFPCDQDDIWLPEKLQIMESLMISNPCIQVLTSNFESFYENGRIVRGPKVEDEMLIKQEVVKDVFSVNYPGCTYCIRKQIVELSRSYWEPDFPHDALLWRLAMFSDSLYSYNKSLIRWRKHSNSTFTKESNQNRNFVAKRESIVYAFRVIKNLERFLDEYDCSRAKEKQAILQTNEKWLHKRAEFFDKRNPILGIGLVKYIKCYGKLRRYLGDVYFVYGKGKG